MKSEHERILKAIKNIKKMLPNKGPIYTLYKGRTFICTGTTREIAKLEDTKHIEVLRYQTKSHKEVFAQKNSKELCKVRLM